MGRVLLCAALTVLGLSAYAQPANDNFANAEEISGLWGTVTNDLSQASGEQGEPNHAGFFPFATIWYKWTAPQSGEVQLDTLATPTDTVLAVYAGDTLPRLRQLAANDDLFVPALNSIFGLGGAGPSGLRFNARQGQTYYIAIGSGIFGGRGPVILGWAYHSGGVFRFATELDVPISGLVTNLVDTNIVVTIQPNADSEPGYLTSESEGTDIENASTSQTYYRFGVRGVLVTVTRLAGSSGRMLVDYATEEVTNAVGDVMAAVSGTDFQPAFGTLVFEDFEMTKRIAIPVFQRSTPIGPGRSTQAATNRDFAIVLSNARPDDQDASVVSPPRIDGTFGRARIRILDTSLDPNFGANFIEDTNASPSTKFVGPSNAVFNFSRVAHRTTEDVTNYWTDGVTLKINRTGTNRESVTLFYRFNNVLGGNQDNSEERNNIFELQPGSDYATTHPTDDDIAAGGAGTGIHGNNADYEPTSGGYNWPGSGSVTFGQDDFVSKDITIRINNDNLTEFNEDFHVFLYRIVDNNPRLVGEINETAVTILFDDKDAPAGSVDQEYNPDFGANMVPPIATVPPNQPHPGADNTVYGLVVQPDGKSVIVGDFQSFNSVGRNRIVRMNQIGLIDTSFNPGSGANNSITALTRIGSGQFYIGGGFTSYNGTPRTRVARLNANGGLDTTFAPGGGPDGWVWSLAVQPDGKVLVGGEFTTVSGETRTHIARLNTNGVLDATFNPGQNGLDGTVWSIAVQPDGKILVGGEFQYVGGQFRSGIARLNADGTLDTSFDPGGAFDGVVYALHLQNDGHIVAGGLFSEFDFNPRNNVARLNADGSVDLTFDPASSGTDGAIYSITQDADGLYLGGSFLHYNGTHRRSLARIYVDGTLDTTFLDTAYNQFAGLHRSRFTDELGTIYALGLQTDGKVMIAGRFQQVGGGQASAEVRPDASSDFSLWVEPKSRDGVRNRSNVARLVGGRTPGPGNISLASDNHTANENQSALSVSLVRTNGSLGFLSANFEVEDGLAQSGVDYIYNAVAPIYLTSWNTTFLGSEPLATTRMRSDGFFGDNFVPTSIYGQQFFNYTPGFVIVTMLNDNVTQGDRNTTFRLSNPSIADQFYLGGENIPIAGALGFSQAPLNILDDDHSAGTLSFQSVNFVVNENVTNAVVTVIRTNGSYGTVTLQYSTLSSNAPGYATVGVDYQARSGPLTFANGQIAKTFTIPIIDDGIVENDELISLRLSNPGGGASLGISNAVVTIVDNDTPGGRLNFNALVYTNYENSGSAAITVVRNGSGAGTLTVQVVATNGTAINGVDFTAFTNTLTWASGDVSSRTVFVPLIDDLEIEPAKTVKLFLSGPTLNSSASFQSLGAVTNATLTILDDDSSGVISFSTSQYVANENGGQALVTVVRQGGESETISVNYAAFNGTAVGGFDFTPTNGTLAFGPGELAKSFAVSILNNDSPDAERFISLALSNAVPTNALGVPSSAIIQIRDDESFNEPPGGSDSVFVPSGMNEAVFALSLQTNGAILAGGDFTTVNQVSRTRLVRMSGFDGQVDGTFNPSANATVRSILSQSDGRTAIGGAFTVVNNVVRNHLARLNSNGSLDTTFDPGSGTDNPIFSIAESFIGTNRVLFLGGAFTTYNGEPRNGIARISNEGALDNAFNPGAGANGIVYAVATYPTNTLNAGKVLIAGEFTAVNGVGRNRIARLNPDGSVDLSFDPGTGAGDSIRALALQTDGRILIGGAFTNFNGTVVHRLARLLGSGDLDATFNAGEGANDTVNTIVVQGDTRIIVGGQFTRCNGVTRNHLTRLNSDGTVDPTINFGTGANNFVAAAVAQPDGKIVIGGGFTEYDGQPRNRIARIYGASAAGSGTFEFTASGYVVNENATNALLTVRRRGGTAGQPGSPNITVKVVSTDITATNGIHYLGGTNTLIFPPGEVQLTLSIPIIDDFEVNADRVAQFSLTDISPVGAASLGNQPTTLLTIINDDSAVSFSAANYTRNENSTDGQATINIIRTGSVLGTASVEFLTTTNGTATLGLDYYAVTNVTVSFAPGETVKPVTVTIVNDNISEGDETVFLQLTNITGALLLSPASAVLTIVDDDFAPGRLAFATPGFTVGENATNAVISIIRTNGRSGVVSAQLLMTDVTATSGVDYQSRVVSVVFGDGETNKTVLVPILDDTVVEGVETFNLTLTNATGGAALLAPTTVPVTILDNDAGITFGAPVYLVTETGPSVSITVLRINGSNGVASVNYCTTNITATAGADYTTTCGTLTFANGEIAKSFPIPILQDTIVEGDETFGVTLSNPSSGVVLLNSMANVSILDDDTGFAFSPATYVVSENGGTNLFVTVVRTNANTPDPITVSFIVTTNGTATLGADFSITNQTQTSLTFTNGEASKTIAILVNDDNFVEGDETIQVMLTSASGGAQFIGATEATITIVDDDAGFAFSSEEYSVLEGTNKTITVLRSGITNSAVSVDFAISDGTATNDLDYFRTEGLTGTLTFTNGETVKTFDISAKADGLEEGDETVNIKLLNPSASSQILGSAATLTIVDADGSLVLPAGALLTAENVSVNGAIDVGERVTALFALRNISGIDTANLTATLLATNGVTAPSAAQNYGALETGGASVSRPFTFTAVGTNGSVIAATFELREGNLPFGRATFNFLLGTSSATFSNLATIVINDSTNGTAMPATPYPSTINVSGMGGSISKVVVVLTNVAHQSPQDIDILLAGPANKSMILMSDAGQNFAITNVTLTFDDTAAGSLPNNSVLTTSTNKPTNYLSPDSFPQPAPSAPYAAALTTFNGSNPNGAWSLFTVDDFVLDKGSITRGWYLFLTTSGTVPAASDLSVHMNVSPDPGIITSNLVYTVLVTNHGPWSATGILLTNELPVGAVFVSATSSAGTIATNNAGQVIWTIGSLTMDASVTATITVRANVAGDFVSTSSVAGLQTDPNPENSTVVLSTVVNNFEADLVAAALDFPDPLYFGNNLTYTLYATNLGPATATQVKLVHTLPAGMTFLSATPQGYTRVGQVVTFTNLGNLGAGAVATATVIVHPTQVGTFNYSTEVSSPVFDPFKALNTFAGKTVVDYPPLSPRIQGNNLILAWPADTAGYTLESAPSLTPPVVWTPVTVPAPVTSGGEKTVTIPVGESNKFFRLRAVMP